MWGCVNEGREVSGCVQSRTARRLCNWTIKEDILSHYERAITNTKVVVEEGIADDRDVHGRPPQTFASRYSQNDKNCHLECSRCSTTGVDEKRRFVTGTTSLLVVRKQFILFFYDPKIINGENLKPWNLGLQQPIISTSLLFDTSFSLKPRNIHLSALIPPPSPLI